MIPMIDEDAKELESFRATALNQNQNAAIVITTKQLTTFASLLTALATSILGGGYLTMTAQVEDVVDEHVDASVADKVIEDVATKDQANRRIVKEELSDVMVRINARADADRKVSDASRAGFKTQIADISKSMLTINDKLESMDAADAEQRRELDRKFTSIEKSTRDMAVDIRILSKGQK